MYLLKENFILLLIIIFTLFLFIEVKNSHAQNSEQQKEIEFIVKPYLVKPGTDKMTIMFESFCALPKVYYKQKDESSFSSISSNIIPLLPTLRKTELTNLKSNTEYEYYIATPLRRSATYTFKTWPDLDDNVDIVKIAAISDSQGNHPQRLKDVIVNGIIKREANSSTIEAGRTISAILVAGDLVTDGNDKSQWVDEFFKNMHPLISHVPILPALGNHDMFPFLYACYFDLIPELQRDIKESRLYNRVDLLNTSILTLDSNNLIDIENIDDYEDSIQKLWLDHQLLDISTNPSIDFMIAQFHHPCKSELWTPGNSSRSCDYVSKFEEFTKESNKPSFHLFGHTHAYSRGQSKDVAHFWVNVASTAGALDNWGEFEMEDYDEFQKSYDEYGYSMLTIKRGEAPLVHFVRRSGGDDIYKYDYEVINDDFTIALNNSKPYQPQLSVEVNGIARLSGSKFADPDNDTHLETNWQISKTINFDDIVKDIWGNKTRIENIWYDENIQQGVDITKISVEDLEAKLNYFARVRYRDSGFKWSNWSDPVKFTLE